MESTPSLIFVYNADSGLFNALSDAAHKALSPTTYQCTLCRLTYGLIAEKQAWRRFIHTLSGDCIFLHRDELRRRYPALALRPPAVLSVGDTGEPSVCIDAEALNRCDDLAALMDLVRNHCLAR